MPSGASERSSAWPCDTTIDPWRRMSCVPPSAAMPLQSDLPPAPFLPLATDEPWAAAVDAFRLRHPRRRERIDDYDRLLAAGDHLRVGEEVLAGRHRPEPPTE